MARITAEHEIAIDTKYQAAAKKQPDTDNYLMNNSFKFSLERIPHVTYFCQRASIPTISFNTVEQSTPYGVRVYKSGTSYEYSDLEIGFIVDENMENWLEIYNWMNSLSNAEDDDGYIEVERHASTAEIITLTSAYRPNIAINFKEVFPISLSSIDFDSTTSETEPVIASATFRYRSYSISDIKTFT